MTGSPSGDPWKVVRRRFLQAGAGALGASAVLGGPASAQTPGTGWTEMTGQGNGEFTHQYDAPAPIDPEGLLGTVQYRVLAGGREVLTADLGLGIDPNGRNFVFDQEDGSARLRGVVVSQDGQVAVELSGTNLTVGARYALTIEADGIDPIVVDFVASGEDGVAVGTPEEGDGETVYGPTDAPAGFPEENELTLTVSGTLPGGESTGEFDANNVSGPNPTEEAEPPEGETPTFTGGGYTLTSLAPLAEPVGDGTFEVEIVGGQTHEFRVSVAPSTDVTVQINITTEEPERPPVPTENWFPLEYDSGTGRFEGQWFAPGTADAEGLLGGFFMRVRDRRVDAADPPVVAEFEAELGIDPPGREFNFSGRDGRAQIRGAVVVFEGQLGIAIRGDQLPGASYTFTAAPPSGDPVTLTLRTDDRGRISGGYGPAPTDFPEDESELTLSVSGEGFEENNVEGPGPIPPADPADPAPTVIPANDASGVGLAVFDPEVEELNPGYEVEVVGDDVYPIRVEVTERGGDGTSVLRGDDVVVEWQAIAGGEVLGPPGPETQPRPEPGTWYPMRDEADSKLLAWQAPPVVNPAGAEGTLSVRAVDGDRTVVRFDSEMTVDPDALEFDARSATEARITGSFAIEATNDGRVIGADISGRDLAPGEQYTVTFTGQGSDPGRPFSITEQANGDGEFSVQFGPRATTLPLEESLVSVSVSGQGFGDDTEIEFEPLPPAPDETPIAVRSDDGQYILWLLEPATSGTVGSLSTLVFGGDVVPFRTKVTDASLGTGATTDQVLAADAAPFAVEWRLLLEGVSQAPITLSTPEPPAEDPPAEEPPAQQPPAEQPPIEEPPAPSPGPLPEFTELIISSRNIPGTARYRFTVSGTVTAAASPRGDQILDGGTTAQGAVSTGADGYRFTGAITSFTIDDPGAVEITIKRPGETEFTRVDPGSLARPDAPAPPTPTPPADAPRPGPERAPPAFNTIVVSSQNIPGNARYQFTVDGQVTALRKPPGDQVTNDGRTATGTVWTYKDGYQYVGTLLNFQSSGPVEVFVNGVQIDPSALGVGGGGGSTPTPSPTTPTAPTFEKKLTISSRNIPGDSAYDFSVAGGTIRPTLTGSRDRVIEDGARAVGKVWNYLDEYRYTGTIDRFTAANPDAIEVFVNGRLVPLSEIVGK